MRQLLRNLALVALMCVPWVTQGQQAIPYSYGFEDNDLSADGWTKTTTNSSSGISSQSASHEGSYLFRFNYNESGTCLISPELTGTESGVSVSFWYANYTTSYREKFQVGYSTTGNDPASDFTFGDEVEGPASSTAWVHYENNFPAGTKYIAIKYIYTNAYYLYIDDFSFTAPPSALR